MRAWRVEQHGEPRHVLQRVDVDDPVPGPGELRLRVRAAAVGLPDVLMCRGSYPLTPPLPFVPGQEVCGVVDTVGADVDAPVGARVMAVTSFMDGRGGFADWAIAGTGTAFRVPDEMSDADAAGFRIGFSTAWIGLVRRGALAATGGRGVDLVYDPVGGEPAATATRTLAAGGRLLAIGFASGEWARPATHDLVRRNASLVGVYAGGLTREESEADHEALLALAAGEAFVGTPTVVGFDELPGAAGSVADGSAVGKVVVRVHDDDL